MADERKPTSQDEDGGIPGEAWMGGAIVLVAVAMVLQSYLFEGDKLSGAGRSLVALF